MALILLTTKKEKEVGVVLIKYLMQNVLFWMREAFHLFIEERDVEQIIAFHF